eukprot:6192906-Pleurochrysis_carterae.AAC.1
MERNSILLYDAEFTNLNHLTALTKKSIIKVLSKQQTEEGKLAYSRLPSAWRSIKFISKQQTKKSRPSLVCDRDSDSHQLDNDSTLQGQQKGR